MFALIICWILLTALAPAQLAAQPQSRPLIQPSDITYVGFFRVPEGDSAGCNADTGNHCFTYGGHALAYNPARNSLFFGGHDWLQRLSEIGIPSDFSTTAPVLQDLADVTDGKLGQTGSNNNKISGTLVYNNRLIVTGSVYYGAHVQHRSHGASGLTLSTGGDFTGFSPMNAAEPRGVSGWMTTIPSEWQPLLGGPALTGNCCYPGNQDTSNGPAAIVFNPDDVGVKDPIPGTTVLYYPFSNPIAPYTSRNPYYNLATVIRGIAFPNGSRSVLFFGRQGMGPYCYGPGTRDPSLGGKPSGNGVDPWCYDPSDGDKGTHSFPYRHQVWAYDANDLLLVKKGSKRPWTVMPYAVWELKEMNSGGGAKIRGAAYDPSSGRLYIAQDYVASPRVDVYQITVPGFQPPPASTP